MKLQNFKSFFIIHAGMNGKFINISEILVVLQPIVSSQARTVKNETKISGISIKKNINFCEQQCQTIVFAIDIIMMNTQNSAHTNLESNVFLQLQFLMINEMNVFIPTAYWSTVSETESNIDKKIIILNTVNMSSLLIHY